jgi:hypothetical protein
MCAFSTALVDRSTIDKSPQMSRRSQLLDVASTRAVHNPARPAAPSLRLPATAEAYLKKTDARVRFLVSA